MAKNLKEIGRCAKLILLLAVAVLVMIHIPDMKQGPPSEPAAIFFTARDRS